MLVNYEGSWCHAGLSTDCSTHSRNKKEIGQELGITNVDKIGINMVSCV